MPFGISMASMKAWLSECSPIVFTWIAFAVHQRHVVLHVFFAGKLFGVGCGLFNLGLVTFNMIATGQVNIFLPERCRLYVLVATACACVRLLNACEAWQNVHRHRHNKATHIQRERERDNTILMS